jgi:hypothetical protein
MTGHDGLKTNGYRVLRLSVGATLADIHKASATMRRAASLGIASAAERDLPQLGEISRTEADIRAAVGRLENPVQRLVDRLFWFHQTLGAEDAKPPYHADGAELSACSHDDALRVLFAAFQAGVDDAGVALWGQALSAWRQTVSNDDYWALSLTLENCGNFEPPALLSEVDDLRDIAVKVAAEPLLVSARDALARDDTPTVRRIMTALGNLSDTGSWAAAAQLDIIFPTVENFRKLCRSVREELGTTIVREQNAGEHNKGICDAELKYFRSKIEPALDRLRRLVPSDHEVSHQAREEAALCLGGIGTDFTWADDFITTEKLREEAVALAKGTLGAIGLEAGLEEVRVAARRQRVFGPLVPISSAPSLSTVNGFGFSIYGNSDPDADSNSYVTTHYFVALFFPIFPIARYRVINAGSQYRFLGKLPLRRGDRWHLGIAAAAIVGMILAGTLSSYQNSSSTFSPSSTTRSYVPPVSAPIAATKTSTLSLQKTQLSALKVRIDAGRARVGVLNTQLGPVVEELDGLNARMKAISIELEALAAKQKAGGKINIESYNEQVEAHNALLVRHRAISAANAADMKAHDDLIDQDAELVRQYNALLN